MNIAQSILRTLNISFHRMFLHRISFDVWYDIKTNSEDWKLDTHRLVHTPTKQEFWVGNGGFFFNAIINENHSDHTFIGLIDRHIVFLLVNESIKQNRKKAIEKAYKGFKINAPNKR